MLQGSNSNKGGWKSVALGHSTQSSLNVKLVEGSTFSVNKSIIFIVKILIFPLFGIAPYIKHTKRFKMFYTI
jgi:hypothetical protein